MDKRQNVKKHLVTDNSINRALKNHQSSRLISFSEKPQFLGKFLCLHPKL